MCPPLVYCSDLGWVGLYYGCGHLPTFRVVASVVVTLALPLEHPAHILIWCGE